MNRFKSAAFVLSLGLAATSPCPRIFAQVAQIQLNPQMTPPAAAALAPRPLVLKIAAAPSLRTGAAVSKAPARGISMLQGAAKALSQDREKSGGAQAPRILQALYGERTAQDDAVPATAGTDSRLLPRLAGAKAPSLGVDASAMDLSVRPQDDLFRYVSGAWLKAFKIPDDKSSYGVDHELSDKAELAIKAIIDKTSAGAHTAGDDGQRIADLYKSFMNAELVETKGLEPIAGALAKIKAVRTKSELPGVFARALREGAGGPVALYVDQDSKDPSSYITTLGQSGLGLPDRAYYFNEDETSANIRAKYEEYLTKLFALAGEDDAAAKAASVFALEKTLALHQWKKEDNRDPDKTYNKTSVGELDALAPGFDWTSYLREAKVRQQEKTVIVGQPGYLKGLAQAVNEQPLETWKLYLKARTLSAAAPYLPAAFVEAAFEYKERTLRGQPQMRPRWKRGVGLAESSVGELIGQIYVKENYPASSKAKMSRMIEDLRAAYAERIQSLDWMGAQTKVKALDKLAKFTPKIGYPDKWRDYSKLDIRADDLLGNVRRSNLHDYDFMIAKLGSPVDRGEWGMTPQTVNAYYNPVMNEIVFPAAILQGVYFNPEADDAVNYGAIGAVIGHEMSHGFDDEGSKYDGDGVLKSWWTPEDRAEFETRAGKLIKQFDGYSPLPGKRINGQMTLGENIGDLGGIIAAYEAYRRSLNGAQAPVIDGFTGDQRFFLGYAQSWRLAIRDEALELQLGTDPHSPAEYRVNGVMPNVPAFYKAFGVKEGDKLYLPEKDRVKIW